MEVKICKDVIEIDGNKMDNEAIKSEDIEKIVLGMLIDDCKIIEGDDFDDNPYFKIICNLKEECESGTDFRSEFDKLKQQSEVLDEQPEDVCVKDVAEETL